MPLATLNLISLQSTNKLPSFVQSLTSLPASSPYRPVILSKVVRWIITPSHVDADELLNPSKPWDLLYIHLTPSPALSTTSSNTTTTTNNEPTQPSLPPSLEADIHDSFTLQVGIPSRLLTALSSKSTNTTTNTSKASHHHESTSTPPLSNTLQHNQKIRLTSSSQDLTLSTDLYHWISSSFAHTRAGTNPVSMLNLLCFHPDKKEDYLVYGREFARSIGKKRGGNAKLVGNVVYPSPTSPSHSPSQGNKENKEKQRKWDEFAVAEYPSIMHFADMLISDDYQTVNQKYRVPSLADTCILCTSEILVDDMLGLSASAGAGGVGAKL